MNKPDTYDWSRALKAADQIVARRDGASELKIGFRINLRKTAQGGSLIRRRNTALTAEQAAKAHTLRSEEGLSFAEIAWRLRVPASRVRDQLNKPRECAVCQGRFYTCLKVESCRHCMPIWTACHAPHSDAVIREIPKLNHGQSRVALGYARRANLGNELIDALRAHIRELGGAR